MVFNSIPFLIFFPLVAIFYFVIPHRFRVIYLLIASYFFYMSWNPIYAILILISTAITYFSGIFIDKCNSFNILSKDGGLPKNSSWGGVERTSLSNLFNKYPIFRNKKLYVVLSLVLNLSILFFFKYFYFFLDNLNLILSAFQIELIKRPFDILLPIGISFYTFQALSYTIDIYRGEVQAERNFFKYALFVAFFPQLVAGPIERSKNFLPQMSEKHIFNYDNMKNGLLLMLYGYFLKMVIADRAAILVNNVFENYEAYHGLELVIAIFSFSLQIYGDFAGYTYIAIGAALVMGFRLMQNFNHPYFSVSIQDFWRRWHISMSSWFRYYVYIPLGGSRTTVLKKYRNIFITFLVSGLWHGAAWNYIFWGVLHGFYLIVGDALMPIREKVAKLLQINTLAYSYKVFRIFITFLLVSYAWLFFRAPDFETAITITKYMLEWNPWIFFDGSLFNLGLNAKNIFVLIFATMILWGVSFCQERFKVREKLAEQNLVFRWMIYILSVVIILVFGVYGPGYDASQFIYFQF